jgi:hypothetical protein
MTISMYRNCRTSDKWEITYVAIASLPVEPYDELGVLSLRAPPNVAKNSYSREKFRCTICRHAPSAS